MRIQPNPNFTKKNAVHTPAAATAAVVTLAADPNETHVIDDIWWSYSASPTGGEVHITIGGVEVYSILVTQAGPGHIQMNGFHGAKGLAVVVTVPSGGGAVVGTVNVQYR